MWEGGPGSYTDSAKNTEIFKKRVSLSENNPAIWWKQREKYPFEAEGEDLRARLCFFET